MQFFFSIFLISSGVISSLPITSKFSELLPCLPLVCPVVLLSKVPFPRRKLIYSSVSLCVMLPRYKSSLQLSTITPHSSLYRFLICSSDCSIGVIPIPNDLAYARIFTKFGILHVFAISSKINLHGTGSF